jgi:hypothetical protein
VVTVPAVVWRGGLLRRTLIIGGTVGLCLGAMTWLDSGFLLSGVIVLIVVGVFYGIWMSRRMARFWPGAKDLTGDERVAVAHAARRGERIDDPRLAQPVIDYSSGLHAAEESGRPWRGVLVFVFVVAAGMAAFDAVFGSWGNAVASAIYLAALLAELFWWPKRRQQLLGNGDRAAELARESHISD